MSTTITTLVPIIGVVAAIIGALVGAFASRLLSRPKPRIVTDQVSIDSIGSESSLGTAPVTINQAIATACEETPFVTDLAPKTQKVPEKEYIDYLSKVIEEVDEMLDHRLPMVKDVAQRLREQLHFKEYENFQKTWSEHQSLIWEVIDVGHYRQDFSYPGRKPTYQEGKEVYSITNDPNTEDYWVYVGGYRPIGFVWSHRRRSAGKAKEFAERTAKAFAYRNIKDLKALIQFLNEQAPSAYSASLGQLKELVQNELNRYRRFVVRGQATNIGRSPLSVLNRCRMFVQVKGHPHSENGRQSHLTENTKIDMILFDASERALVPLSVGPGEVRRFVAVSETYVDDVRDREILLDIFDGGDKRFYLGVVTTLSTQRTSKAHHTKPQYFRDWATELDIPPRWSFSNLSAPLLRRHK